MGVFRATPGPSGPRAKRQQTALSTTESDSGPSSGRYRGKSESGSHPVSDAFVAANSAMRDPVNPIEGFPKYSGLPYNTKDLSHGFSNYGSSSSEDKGKDTNSSGDKEKK